MAIGHSNRQPANHLLRSVSRAEQKSLLAKMERIELTPRRVLYDPDKAIEHVFFPEDGVVSLVRNMKEGSTLEIATIGKEGMVGLPVFLGAVSSPLQAFAQVPGHALQLSTADFKHAVMNGFGLRRVLERYTQALFTQLSQSVACNRVHSIEQRCARWLLLTADRVQGLTFHADTGISRTNAGSAPSKRQWVPAGFPTQGDDRIQAGPDADQGSSQIGRGVLRVLLRCQKGISETDGLKLTKSVTQTCRALSLDYKVELRIPSLYQDVA